MAFKCPNQYRTTLQGMPFGDDTNGVFAIPTGSENLIVIASDGMGWEHVSVSLRDRTPTWDEMCYVKLLFWGDEDCVIQYHPPKSEYINNHPYCLHLWRPVGLSFPAPPTILVGV